MLELHCLKKTSHKASVFFTFRSPFEKDTELSFNDRKQRRQSLWKDASLLFRNLEMTLLTSTVAHFSTSCGRADVEHKETRRARVQRTEAESECKKKTKKKHESWWRSCCNGDAIFPWMLSAETLLGPVFKSYTTILSIRNRLRRHVSVSRLDNRRQSVQK